MKNRITRGVAMAVPVLALLAAAAPTVNATESVAEFYGKKGLRMVVASGAGGGYDTYTRAFVRHYVRHLPGKPSIVVQNMPGASGIVATNWIYNQAPRDGSVVLATYQSLIDENLLGNDKAKFNVRKLNWLGSIAKTHHLCVTWHTSPIRTIQQVIGKPVNVSSTGRAGNSATVPLLLNQSMGTKFKVIAGYSTTGSRLALERGEVEAICGLGISTLRASNPEWFINKRINVILQIGLDRHPEFPNVPNALELVNEKDKPVFEFFGISQEMGRPYAAPPDVPADRLKALRDAFMTTANDPAFKKEMEKLLLAVEPLSGQEMETLITRLYGFPQGVLNRVGELLGVAAQERVDACLKVAKDSSQCAKPKKKKKKKKQ